MTEGMFHPIHCAKSANVASFADYTSGNIYTDIVRMSDFDELHFLVIRGAGAVGTATIEVNACDDSTPTTNADVAFTYRVCATSDTWGAWTASEATGFTTTAAADYMYQIKVKASDLTDGYGYVRLKLTEVDSTACDGAILALGIKGRYNPKARTAIP